MKIVGCDLHAGQQSIAMVDSETGELTEKVVKHEGNAAEGQGIVDGKGAASPAGFDAARLHRAKTG